MEVRLLEGHLSFFTPIMFLPRTDLQYNPQLYYDGLVI